MNQKWRIIIGICLMMMVCEPLVSAVIQFPASQNSLTQSSSDRLKFIKPPQYARENIRVDQKMAETEIFYEIENIWKRKGSFNSDISKTPTFNRQSFMNWKSQAGSIDADQYITKEAAIDIATARFPGICLMEPITASFKQKNTQAHSNWVNPYWVVTIIGYNPEGDPCDLEGCYPHENVVRDYFSYGGIVFIDAISGEILDIYLPS